MVSGRPLPSTFSHVSPASVDFQIALPGPPLLKKYGPRTRSQLVAHRMSGFCGCMSMSTKPASSETKLIRSQVSPPSFVRYSPRSSFAPQGCPSAATYTQSAFVGWTTMRPIACVSSSPFSSHVSPPSTDL